MSIRKTNFGQVKLSGTHFDDGELQNGRDDMGSSETLADGEIAIKANVAVDGGGNPLFDTDSNTDGGIVTALIANAAVETAKLKDVGGSYAGIGEGKFADLAVQTLQLEPLAAETVKFPDQALAQAKFRFTSPQAGNPVSEVTMTFSANSSYLQLRPGSLTNDASLGFDTGGSGANADFSFNTVSGAVKLRPHLNNESLTQMVTRLQNHPDFDATISTSTAADGHVITDVGQMTVTVDFGAGLESERGQGIQTDRFADSTGTTDGVTTDKIQDTASATTGVLNADLGLNSVITSKIVNLNVTSDKLAADSVTTSKMKDIDTTTTTMGSILVINQAGGSGNIAGKKIRIGCDDNSMHGVNAHRLRIEIDGDNSSGVLVEFDNDTLLLHIADNDDKVSQIIAGINALPEFSAANLDHSVTELDTAVDLPGNIAVFSFATDEGHHFYDMVDPANPEQVYTGIQTAKFENSTSGTTGITNALFDGSAIDAEKIKGHDAGAGYTVTAEGVFGRHGVNAGPVSFALISDLNFKHDATSQVAGTLPADDASIEDYTNITGIGAQAQNLDMESGVSSTKYKIVNLPTEASDPGSKLPFAATDLVSKEYVDSVGAGSQWKEPVRVASRTDYTGVSLSGSTLELASNVANGGSDGDGTVMIDNVKVLIGDRILLLAMNGGGGNRGLNGIWKCTRQGRSSSIALSFMKQGVFSDQKSELANARLAFELAEDDGSNVQVVTSQFVNGGGSVSGDDLGGGTLAIQISGALSLSDIAKEIDDMLSIGFTGAVAGKAFIDLEENNNFAIFRYGRINVSDDSDASVTNGKIAIGSNTANHRLSVEAGSKDVDGLAGSDFGNGNAALTLTGMTGGVRAQFERPSDADSGPELMGLGVFVEEGDYYHDVAFHLTFPNSVSGFTLNTTSLIFSQKTALGMHSTNSQLEMEPSAQELRVASAALGHADLEMTIVRRQIVGSYDSSAPFNGNTLDPVLIEMGGNIAGEQSNGKYLVWSKYEFQSPVFQDDGVTPQGSHVGNNLSAAGNPLLIDHKHQLFLNGVLLKMGANKGEVIAQTADYCFVEGDSAENFNSNDRDGDGATTDETKVSAGGINGPQGNSSNGAPSLENPVALFVEPDLIAPGDVFELRVLDRHRFDNGGFHIA